MSEDVEEHGVFRGGSNPATVFYTAFVTTGGLVLADDDCRRRRRRRINELNHLVGR